MAYRAFVDYPARTARLILTFWRFEKMENAKITAFNAGVEFAEYLNNHPYEKQNWGELARQDGIPEGDYIELTRRFGGCTGELEEQYRAGFNETLE